VGSNPTLSAVKKPYNKGFFDFLDKFLDK